MDDRSENLPDSYNGLLRRGESEIKVRGSRFFGLAVPVRAECEVDGYLREHGERYPDAGHHVYAYRIGKAVSRERYSDDGEPAKTAGMPLLSLLSGRGLVDTLVIVTRIFGGTLLGKGGLVRAYSEAGRRAIRAAKVARYVRGHDLVLRVPYALWGTLEYGLHERGHAPIDVEYLDHVRATVWSSCHEKEDLEEWLAEMSGGTLHPCDRGTRYVARKVIEE